VIEFRLRNSSLEGTVWQADRAKESMTRELVEAKSDLSEAEGPDYQAASQGDSNVPCRPRRLLLSRRVLPVLIVAAYFRIYVFSRVSGILVHQARNSDMDNPAAPRGEIHDIGSVVYASPTSQGPSEFVAVCRGVFYPLIHAELRYSQHERR
jgi:hypothetical protein